MLSGWFSRFTASDDTKGNALVMGIATITLLSIFGVVMAERMIIDAHAAAKRVVATKAFYVADGGIQYGRRYLQEGGSDP